VKRVIVLMEHTTRSGAPKILHECSLPLTGVHVVNRIITDIAVFDVTPRGLLLVQLAADVDLDEVRAKTEPIIHLPVTHPSVAPHRA
jgi:3-oxoacid CoA-transferase subunit B